MITSIILLIVGLLLLLGGSDLLVRGASALARRAGVPPLVVGLTVVAFGTSTPEVVVNVTAAVHGETELLFGNVVGSCTINVGWVLALTALVKPLAVESVMITREIPMLLLGVAALVVMSFDRWLGSAASDMLVRSDGLVLLLLFAVFIYYTVHTALTKRPTDALIEEVEDVIEQQPKPLPLWRDIAITLAGLIGVGAGGRLTVIGAVGIATQMNVPEAVIGLTIVSFGTTLPELVTCLVAARRGQGDIAMGNIVGSCIFNLLFVGGLCASIRAVPIPMGGGHLDLVMMAGLCAALFPMSLTGRRHITRPEGALLLVSYLAYATWRGVGAISW